jgi:CheY-like chemotaxis protein
MSSEREKTLAAGCDEFATKPIDLPHLLGLIRRFAPAGRPGAADVAGTALGA